MGWDNWIWMEYRVWDVDRIGIWQDMHFSICAAKFSGVSLEVKQFPGVTIILRAPDEKYKSPSLTEQ